jgi:hypothetical protein
MKSKRSYTLPFDIEGGPGPGAKVFELPIAPGPRVLEHYAGESIACLAVCFSPRRSSGRAAWIFLLFLHAVRFFLATLPA